MITVNGLSAHGGLVLLARIGVHLDLLSSAAALVWEQNVKSLKTGLVYDEAMKKHACMCTSPLEHPEQPNRISAIWKRFEEKGLSSQCTIVPSRSAELSELEVGETFYRLWVFYLATFLLVLTTTRLPWSLARAQ